MKSDFLSLVVPIYRNEASLDDLLQVVTNLHARLDGSLEAVFVVDGSPDRCWDILRERLPDQAFPSQLILLSRNFGSFPAIRVGLAHGQGARYAVMAADLQEPPELVLDMDAVLRNGDADVVIGVRRGRSDPLLSRLSSGVFWSLYRRYVVPEMPPGGVDIFGCTREFRDNLVRLEERHSSLVAQIFWLGFRRKSLPYSRQARRHGKSGWTFSKKWNYLLDSVFAFTDLPIRMLVRLGALGMLAAFLLGSGVALARIAGMIQVPGYAATIIALVFFSAMNLLSLGIVGSYAWRAYENTKGRPLAVPHKVNVFSPVSNSVSQ